MHKTTINALAAVLCVLPSLKVNAANKNPASVAYVQQYVREAITAAISALTPQTTYTVGQVAQGGVVVYVDSTGQHGLVATLSDVFGGIPYFNTNLFTTAASYPIDTTIVTSGTFSESGIGGGYPNTTNMVALGGVLTSIATQLTPSVTGRVSTDYIPAQALLYATTASGDVCTSSTTPSSTNACLGGWYVPNQYEMVVVYNALCNGSPYALTPTTPYWTSTQAAGNIAVQDALKSPDSLPCPVTDIGSALQQFSLTDLNLHTRFVRQF